jgi:hypothetical protein
MIVQQTNNFKRCCDMKGRHFVFGSAPANESLQISDCLEAKELEEEKPEEKKQHSTADWMSSRRSAASSNLGDLLKKSKRNSSTTSTTATTGTNSQPSTFPPSKSKSLFDQLFDLNDHYNDDEEEFEDVIEAQDDNDDENDDDNDVDCDEFPMLFSSSMFAVKSSRLQNAADSITTIDSSVLTAVTTSSKTATTAAASTTKDAATVDDNGGGGGGNSNSYYVENFLLIVQHALQHHSSLLSPEEIAHGQAFVALDSTAQRLFVRVFHRKGPWFRCDLLAQKYARELGELVGDYIAILTAAGWFVGSDERVLLRSRSMLPLASVYDLRRLCEILGIANAHLLKKVHRKIRIGFYFTFCFA